MSPRSSPPARAASRAKPAAKTDGKPAARKSPRRDEPAPRPAKAKTARARAAPSFRGRAVASLRFCRNLIDKLITGFPDDKLTYQPAMTDNHLIWTLGHLAVTNQWLAGLLDGRSGHLPPRYDELFGYGSLPNPDLAVYPPYAEVRQHYQATFNRLIRAAEGLDDRDWSAPCAQESHGFARDKGEVLDRAVWHEGWHGGQLSALRRSLGLPPVIG